MSPINIGNLRKGSKYSKQTHHDVSSIPIPHRSLKKSRRAKSERKDMYMYDMYLNRAADTYVLTYIGQYGPFGACKGDCDSDADCAGTMVCYQRDGDARVPGCWGYGTWDVDYCIPSSLVVEDEQRQDDPTSQPTEAGDTPAASPTSDSATSSTALPPTASDTLTPTTTPASSPTTSSSVASSPTTNAPTAVPTTTESVTESPTIRTTDDSGDDTSSTSGMGPTPSPSFSLDNSANFAPTANSSLLPSNSTNGSAMANVSDGTGPSNSIASINRGDEYTTSTEGLNSPSDFGGLAIMGFAFLSLLVLAVLGLAVKKTRSRRLEGDIAATSLKINKTTSTDIVPIDEGNSVGPRWGDGSSMMQLTQAFEGENGIEIIDIKSTPSIMSDPSIKSSRSLDSFAAEPAPLPYDSALHDKYPKLFGLPELDPDNGDLDTVEL
mmetsp:Transcript_28034/g.61083  ORF Transcript_28034/g.61083 Transcript_28034/m.61083 type:complete len:437 (-) Transcript_28034:126-1436(-)